MVLPNEWLQYDVTFATTGLYSVTFRTASNSTNPKMAHLEVDGADVTGPVLFPAMGSWQVRNCAAPRLQILLSSPKGSVLYFGLQFSRMWSNLNATTINYQRPTPFVRECSSKRFQTTTDLAGILFPKDSLAEYSANVSNSVGGTSDALLRWTQHTSL